MIAKTPAGSAQAFVNLDANGNVLVSGLVGDGTNTGAIVIGDKNGLAVAQTSQTIQLGSTGAQSTGSALSINAAAAGFNPGGANPVGQAYIDMQGWAGATASVTSLQAGTASLLVKVSNDGVLWTQGTVSIPTTVSGTAATNVLAVNTNYLLPSGFRYLQLTLNGAATSGTTTVNVHLVAAPPTNFVTYLGTNTNTVGNVNANAQSAAVLASAARTATTTSATQNNAYSQTALIILNVTAASGTGGLSLQLLIVDPVSGSVAPINVAPTSVTAVGTYTFIVGLAASSTGLATNVTPINAPLPFNWQVKVTHGDASSYTYSVGSMVLN